MNLIDMVIAWVMLVLTPANEDRPVVRIGHVTAPGKGQEVQADAANRLAAVQVRVTPIRVTPPCLAGPKCCRGPPNPEGGRRR